MPFKFKKLFLFFLLFYYLWQFYMELNSTGLLQYVRKNFGTLLAIQLEITTTFSFFLYALSAYFFLWYFTRRRKQFWAFVCIVGCIPLVILFRYFLEEVFCPAVFGFRNYNPNVTLSYYLQDNKYFSIPNTAFGIIFYFLQSNRYKEQEKAGLQIQNRQAELDYLKAQINPHFLLNNLNNIYSLIYHKSDQSLFAVEQLSSLLKYMLYEKREKVLLTDEIKYLENFIELQKLRYNYELPLSITNNIQDNGLHIAPMMLIPLLENAFKHGDFRDKAYPLVVNLHTTGNQLLVVVQNKKGNFEKDQTPGIGIVNLKRRLALIYGNNHSFKIEEDGTIYKTTLEIKV